MHVTCRPGPSPLAIVLPQPQLPRPRLALASGISTPRTPRTPSSASNILFAVPPNRNSTDSWNSSNGPDEHECDWKPEQIRLLSRTLDALPAHLVTPFNGPTPPSNLLHKIAHGVSQAKGPIDWPHSIRATRVKLIELSRARANEKQARDEVIPADCLHSPDHLGKPSIKRPLYRQSSMDFMNTAEVKEKTNDIACLADRLQDRLASDNLYHPYSRRTYRPAVSTPHPTNFLNPSTPSSSTLNTLSSFSTYNRILHRTDSNLSSTSASSLMSGPPGLTDTRIQRVRKSDRPPAPPPKDIKISSAAKKENVKDLDTAVGMKRAPSFGTLAQEIKRERHQTGNQENKDPSSYPSSDEEEKLRTLSAKKMRVKDALSPGSPLPLSPIKKSNKSQMPASVRQDGILLPRLSPSKPKTKPRDPQEHKVSEPRKKNPPPPMNFRRNPSMFGPELPLPVMASSPAHLAHVPSSPVAEPCPPSTPSKLKTLRRVRRLAPGRRISFGSLAASGDDADGEADEKQVKRGDRMERQRQRDLCQLESAFQLN